MLRNNMSRNSSQSIASHSKPDKQYLSDSYESLRVPRMNYSTGGDSTIPPYGWFDQRSSSRSRLPVPKTKSKEIKEAFVSYFMDDCKESANCIQIFLENAVSRGMYEFRNKPSNYISKNIYNKNKSDVIKEQSKEKSKRTFNVDLGICKEGELHKRKRGSYFSL